MEKPDKQQIAIFLFIGLVVVGGIIYTISEFYPSGENSEKEKREVMFEAPNSAQDTKEKEKYKSTLEIYEQQHKNEEPQREPVSFSFDKNEGNMGKGNERPADPTTPATVTQQVIPVKPSNPTKKSSKSREQKAPVSENSNQVEYAEAEEEEPIRTRKRGMVTATKIETETSSEADNSQVNISAVFHGDQHITTGKRVKLRVTKAFEFHETTIPSGTILLGNASFAGDYVYVSINSIEVNGEPVICNFSGYKNGQMGIYAPSNENKEILNDNINANSSRGVRVSVGTASINTGGLNKKTQAKEKQIFIPSQFSMIFAQGTPNH